MNIPSVKEVKVEDLKRLSVYEWTPAYYAAYTDQTCMESSRNHEYLSLGFFSEVGEVLGKLKKVIRDGETAERRSDILSELSDVLWYAARLSDWSKADKFSDWAGIEDSSEGITHVAGISLDIVGWSKDNWTSLCQAAKRAGMVMDCPTCMHNITECLRALTPLVHALGGTWAELARYNAVKLTDRYQRNAITGSGDNR